MTNNFDALRLFLALMIVWNHAYPIAGSTSVEWLHEWTHHQLSAANIRVNSFFVISGFLVYKSLYSSSSWFNFLWRRALRIYPALCVALFATLCLVATVAEGGVATFLQQRSTWTYLPNNLTLLRLQYGIEGVFEHQALPTYINSSLWTMPYEVLYYLILSLLFFLPIACRKYLVGITVVLLLGIKLSLQQQLPLRTFYAIDNKHSLELAYYFFAGVGLSLSNILAWQHKQWYFVGILLLTVSAFYTDYYPIISCFCLPVGIVLLGSMDFPIVSRVKQHIGDCSYGIYLYSFPIQQTLVYYFALPAYALWLASSALSWCCAYWSWRLVEKPSSVWKNWLR